MNKELQENLLRLLSSNDKENYHLAREIQKGHNIEARFSKDIIDFKRLLKLRGLKSIRKNYIKSSGSKHLKNRKVRYTLSFQRDIKITIVRYSAKYVLCKYMFNGGIQILNTLIELPYFSVQFYGTVKGRWITEVLAGQFMVHNHVTNIHQLLNLIVNTLEKYQDSELF